jgi:hypothetical protein
VGGWRRKRREEGEEEEEREDEEEDVQMRNVGFESTSPKMLGSPCHICDILDRINGRQPATLSKYWGKFRGGEGGLVISTIHFSRELVF